MIAQYVVVKFKNVHYIAHKICKRQQEKIKNGLVSGQNVLKLEISSAGKLLPGRKSMGQQYILSLHKL